MTRTATALYVAAAMGLGASAGAQTTTAGTTAAQTTTADSKDIMVVGCLQRGSDGSYMLTNAHKDTDVNRSTTGGGTTAGTTTSGTTGSTATSGSSTAGSSAMATGSAGADAMSTWAIKGGSDLDKHVGHQIQVTGRAAAPGMSSETTTGSTTAAGSTTAGTSGTTGSTGATTTDASKGMGHHTQTLEFKSMKMIAASCS
jgi:hypothetical protein